LPPKQLEVQEAVRRVFKDAAEIDTSHNPAYIAGDFNGDASEDIAVVLKPAPGKIAAMNEEFPAWMLRDLLQLNEGEGTPLRVEENEKLLALIHGHGVNDWRDPQATQTYLLKNAVANGMEARSGSEFADANQGKKIPRVHGDLIRGVLRGSSGYLYYAGATYSWYDPKNFKGEPPRRMVHSRRAN
jgi:hypothetical protein